MLNLILSFHCYCKIYSLTILICVWIYVIKLMGNFMSLHCLATVLVILVTVIKQELVPLLGENHMLILACMNYCLCPSPFSKARTSKHSSTDRLCPLTMLYFNSPFTPLATVHSTTCYSLASCIHLTIASFLPLLLCCPWWHDTLGDIRDGGQWAVKWKAGGQQRGRGWQSARQPKGQRWEGDWWVTVVVCCDHKWD